MLSFGLVSSPVSALTPGLGDGGGVMTSVERGFSREKCRVSHIRRCWSFPAVTNKCGWSA